MAETIPAVLGQRVNTWVSILVFVLGVVLWRRFARLEQPTAPAPSDGTDDGDGAEGPVGPDGVEPSTGHEVGEVTEPEDPSVDPPHDRPNAAAAGAPTVDRPTRS